MISQQQQRKKCFHQVAAASDRYHSIDALHQVARVPRLMQQACQMPALAEILVLQGVLAGLGWAGLGWAGLGWLYWRPRRGRPASAGPPGDKRKLRISRHVCSVMAYLRRVFGAPPPGTPLFYRISFGRFWNHRFRRRHTSRYGGQASDFPIWDNPRGLSLERL